VDDLRDEFNVSGHTDAGEALKAAREVIARQQSEIDTLRSQLSDQQFVRELKQAVVVASAASAITAPITHSHLLELIVQTSMHVTSAKQAALFLIDEETQELRFETTIGPHAAQIRSLRVPLGHGIAGLVAQTGEPMVVTDADRDPRQAADIARAAGYTPKNILCVPLVYGDRIIGALEMMDKQGAHSFAASDIETLGFFAKQAAVAIEQSLVTRNISQLLTTSLETLWTSAEKRKEALQQHARSFGRHLEMLPLYDRALDLAGFVHEIVSAGESEVKLCEAVLRSLTEYLRSRSPSSAAELQRLP
jgi:transcriptional regulator with GAF, ATPase, and Fis domain